MTRSLRRHSSDTQRKPVWFLFGCVLCVVSTISACSLFSTALPGQVDTGSQYDRRVYAGIAGASTRLQPVTEGSAYELDKSISSGMAVTLGLDVATRLALEITAADLGAASLAPIATAGPGVAPQQLTYSTVAGSLLYYVIGDRVRANYRKGLAGYARLGLSQTESSADIQIDEEDAMQLFVGVGAEYMMGRSAGVRAELVGYDGDASAAQLGLVYRFGRAKSRLSGPIVEQTPQKTEPVIDRPEIITPEIPTPVVAEKDETVVDAIENSEVAATTVTEAPMVKTPIADTPIADTTIVDTPIAESPMSAADGPVVAENNSASELPVPAADGNTVSKNIESPSSETSVGDQQIAMVTPPPLKVPPPAEQVAPPATAPIDIVEKKPTVNPTPVQPVVALTLEGVLQGVEFAEGTATLTQTGKRELVRYATLLKQSPSIRVEIRTHTDNIGDTATSMKLTRLRAVSIARALIGAGVKKHQLAARAFGSNVPRADNKSSSGRRLNNRVEFKKL